MTQIADALKPGQIARVRQRTYLVEEIVKPKRVADSTLVRLSCVDDDNQGQRVFESLAKRMEDFPDLDVRFFLNVPRPDRDKTASEILVARFKQRFKDTQWPAACRLPEVYYDPRSVADDVPVRS